MSVSRRKFIRTAAIGSASLGVAPKSRAIDPSAAPQILTRTALSKRPRHPNLLLLWVDQHRGDVLPSAGNRALKAPTLERLGQQSFCFSRAFCAQPVCTPSRATIMTGLLPHNHGSVANNIRLDPRHKCIAEYVPSDYATGYFGKWHLGDEIRPQHGFREWRSIEDGIYRQFYTNEADLKLRSSYHYYLLNAGFPPDTKEEDPSDVPLFSRTMAASMAEQYTKVNHLANEAVDFLDARRDGQPFLLSVNTLEPHSPTYGPLNELHDPADMPAGPAFGVPVGSGASRLHQSHRDAIAKKGYKNHPIGTDAAWRRLRANYYGLVSMVDRAYGRILQALEQSGQADNTIVVYTSDHGDMLGDHGLMGKGVFYEQATHIPLMIHVPWLSRSQVRLNQPINLVDLAPTLLDLMGAGAPSGIDGVSRAAALADPSGWAPEDVVIEWHEKENTGLSGRSLRGADDWKLNLYQGDAPELYDLNSDPGELRNVARDPKHGDRIRRMADEIIAYQRRHGDPMKLQV